MRYGDMVKIVKDKYRCWNGRYGIIIDSFKDNGRKMFKVKVSGHSNISKKYGLNDTPRGWTLCYADEIVIVKKSTLWKRIKRLDTKELKKQVGMLLGNIIGLKAVANTGSWIAFTVFAMIFAIAWAYTGYSYYKKIF
jgi:hypothetical protein